MSKTNKKQPLKEVEQYIKKTAWTSVIESLATILIGIFLIAWPGTIIQIIAYIVGVFLCVKGAYQIINYFIIKGHHDVFNNSLLFGIVSALIGIAALVMGPELASVFRIIIGIWIIYESLVRINISIKLNAVGISAWKYVLILALVMLLLGAYITFSTNAVAILIGWVMILSGVAGIIGDIIFVQHVNRIADKLSK